MIKIWIELDAHFQHPTFKWVEMVRCKKKKKKSWFRSNVHPLELIAITYYHHFIVVLIKFGCSAYCSVFPFFNLVLIESFTYVHAKMFSFKYYNILLKQFQRRR